MTNGNLAPEEERGFQMKPELKGDLTYHKGMLYGRELERKDIIEKLKGQLKELRQLENDTDNQTFKLSYSIQYNRVCSILNQIENLSNG